jgi:centrosomal protein CEP41
MMKKSPVKSIPFMDKKIPKNSKYANVQAKLDTGVTVDKVKYVTAREYSRRREEIFYRITAKQLYELYNEYEADERETLAEAFGDGHGGPRIVSHTEMAQPTYDRPYLILDVREPEDFRKSHLFNARNFPNNYLRRDQAPPELYTFRNKPGMLIIIYCDDERISRESAKLLVDRGTDNIYLLSGGYNDFVKEFPSFVEGDVPPPPASPPKKSYQRTPLVHIPEEQRLTKEALKAGGVMNSARTGYNSIRIPLTSRSRDDKSESGFSTKSNRSVAETIISRAVSRKGKF